MPFPATFEKPEISRRILKGVGRGEALIVAFFCVIAVFTFIGASPGQTISPSYLLEQQEGWKEFNFQDSAGSYERSDVLDDKIPVWLEVKDSLIGESRWNLLENRNGGRPVDDFTLGLISPAFLTFLVIPDSGTAWLLSMVLQATILLLGFYFLGRLFSSSRILVFFLSLLATFSGYGSGWFFWNHYAVFAISPWVIFFTITLMRGVTFIKVAGFFTSTFLLISAGFPQVSALFLYASSAVVIGHVVLGLVSKEKSLIRIFRPPMYWSVLTLLSFTLQSRSLMNFVEIISNSDLSGRGGTTLVLTQDFFSIISPFTNGQGLVGKSIFIGSLLMFAVLGLIATVAEYKKHLLTKWEKMLGLIFALMFILSIGYSFDIALINVMKFLPALGESLFNRGWFVVVLCSFVLSSISIDWLQSKTRRNWHVTGLLIGVFLLPSLIASKFIFSTFNPVTEAAEFFPVPSSAAAVANDTGRFDYTLADDTFLFNGTLTGFGVKEWFAHSQTNRDPDYTSAFNQISSDGKLTPTNVAPSLESIDFPNNLLDELSVSYFMTARTTGPAVYESSQGESKQVPREIFQDSSMPSLISLPDEVDLSEISLLLATYGRPKVKLDKPLKLIAELDDGAQTRVCESSFEVLKDNSWVTLQCIADGFNSLGPGEVEVSLKVDDLPEGLRLASWSYESSKNPAESKKNRTESILRLHEPLTALSQYGWEAEKLDHATVYRNLDSPGGPYILKDDRILTGEENLTWRISQEDSIVAKVRKNGILVFPVGKHGFEKISLNGQEVSASLQHGIMPSVAVNAGDEVALYFYDTDLGLVEAVEFSSIALLALTLLSSNTSRKRYRNRAVEEL